MPTPSELRFEMKNSDDTLWWNVVNGVATTSATPKYFLDDSGKQNVSPYDVNSTEFGYTKNNKWYAVFTKFSVPLSFTYDAMTILKHIYGTDGYEGTAILIISERQPNLNYKEIYRGEIDLSQIENADTEEEIFFKANIAERGLVETLKAQEDIPVEIPFDGDAITVLHDGIKLQIASTWLAGGQQGITYTANANDRLFIDAGYVDTEISSYFVNYYLPATQSLHTTATDSAKYILKTFLSLTCVIDIEFDIDVTLSNLVQADCQLGVRIIQLPDPIPNPATVINHNLYISPSGFFPVNQTKNVKFSGSFADVFPAFSLMKLQVNVSNNVAANGQNIAVKINSLKLKIKSTSRLPSSDIKSFFYPKFLEKLFKKSLGDSVGLVSNYFSLPFGAPTQNDYRDNYDNIPRLTAVTSGSSIRQMEEKSIKTSIGDAYSDMRRFGVGMGVEGNNIRIERLPYFFQKDRVVYDLGEVSNLKYTNANQHLGNKIITGYNKKTFDELNGLDDFNSESIWNFPSKRVQGDINWKSPYNASIYAIEYARALEVKKKDTTDSQYDEEVYLMEVVNYLSGGKYTLNRGIASAITGLLFPESAYNFGLSPATTLRNNAELLLAMATGKIRNNNEPITYQKSDKNNKMSRQMYSEHITENADVFPLDLLTKPDGTQAVPLFKPTYIEYDCYVPAELFAILNQDYQNRYGVVKFTWKGNIFTNFIDDIARLPATNDKYRLKGLSSTDNDIKKL